MTKRNGATILLDALYQNGVEVIFGYPGAKTLKVHDALEDHPIKHILVRHEQAAAHAADGYFRSTGKVGVCLSTSGPGATNLVTGIATAHMDSAGILALTCQVATGDIGSDAFQEADMVGITRPITKHNYLVRDVSEMEETVCKAIHIATTGRPGPVLIDLPSNVLAAETDLTFDRSTLEIRGYHPHIEGHIKQIKKAVKLIAKAEKPVIIAGGGIVHSECAAKLYKLADFCDLPVVSTLMGLGALPTTSPRFVGMIGMYGSWAANRTVHDSDLIIAIGTRFSDRSTCKVSEFAPHAKIVHIDIDPASISKNIHVTIPISGDAGAILHSILEIIEASKHPKWNAEVAGHLAEYQHRLATLSPTPQAKTILEEINRITDGQMIMVTDVGSSQMWCANFSRVDQTRHFLTSGGLGTMGFAIPAAMGAKVANPNMQVIAVAGDGGALMNIQELATLAYYKIPIKIVLFENSKLGMVRQFQDLFLEKRYASVDLGGLTNFEQVARGFQVQAETISDPTEITPALERMLAAKEAYMCVFKVPENDFCFPMTPPGAGNVDMIFQRNEED